MLIQTELLQEVEVYGVYAYATQFWVGVSLLA